MTTYYLSPIGASLQFLSNLGVPLAGGLVNVYVGGSVNTPQVTYTDATGTTQNANPIVLNAAGRIAANNAPVSVWVPQNTPHKLVLTDSTGNLLNTLDGMYGINDPLAVLALLAVATTGSGVDLVANALKSYDTLASLRAANTPALVTGQTLVVYLEGLTTVGDGLGGTFYWSAGSTATDDGYSIAKPTALAAASPGRYLRLDWKNQFIQRVITGSYTLQISDAGNQLFYAGAAAATLTVPAAAILATWPLGAVVEVVNLGSGAITVTGAVPPSVFGFNQSVVNQNNVIGAGMSARIMKVGTDSWAILDNLSPFNFGTFTGTLTGCTVGVTGTVSYKIVGNRVTLYIAAPITGTSNAVNFTMTGLPSALQPSVQRNCTCLLEDNSVITGGWGMVTNGSGAVTFGLTFANAAAGWTAANIKGLPLGWQMEYDL